MKTIKRCLPGALAALCMTAGMAEAREPATPWAVPGEAMAGIPVGANPPPGDYLSVDLSYSPGDVLDADGNSFGVEPDITALVLAYSHVPNTQIWGASYRFTLVLPYIYADETTPGGTTIEQGVGDITISPLNLSWMVSPGQFVSTGVAVNIPTGDWAPFGNNLGSNTPSVSLMAGYSYLKDGWNLTAGATYTMSGANKTTGYESGDDLLVNFTAYKDVGNGFSVGLNGYHRQQTTDDKNPDGAYGGFLATKAKETGLGVGFTKNWGPKQLNVALVKAFNVKDTREATTLKVGYSIPLGK